MPCLFCSFSFLSFDFQTSRTSARNIELTSEESLIYVNLWLLVCQVADQRQFTVGAERAFESSDAFFFFKVDLAHMQQSTTHPCGCLTLLFNCSAQTGDSLTSDDLRLLGLPVHLGFLRQNKRGRRC